MSGVIAWLVGFLDGSVGKYHVRQTHYRPSHFASGHWAGIAEPVVVVPVHRPLRGSDGIHGILRGILCGDPLRGPDSKRGTLRGGL